MCGIAGYLSPHNFDVDRVAVRMSDAINKRGPDDSGYWWDHDSGIVIAHRRLSILDLSLLGHQPMQSFSGRYVIAFNGEIYNHLDLREEIELNSVTHSACDSRLSTNKLNPSIWRGNSDTETLLRGIELWGFEETLKKSVGMFAIALWDKKTKKLFLARDRIGEKPLYFGWQDKGNRKTFLFGSELKALKAHPSFSARVDRASLCLLLRHSYVPSPYSIYEGIQKLEPGRILSVSLGKPEPVIIKFWDSVEIAKKGLSTPFSGSPNQAVNALEILTKRAVNQQMLADVPLGAFLSGGVDSSTIVALMQSQSSIPIKTFTIGFNEADFNEAVYAKKIAKHLGTDHTEMYITPNQAIDIIPKIPTLYCEPFADSSQIPTFFLSQLAKQQVTVSLSGDGGDELFCGYNRYRFTAQLWKKLSLVPAPIRQLMAKFITTLSPAAWDGLGELIPGGKRYASFGDKLHKGAGVLASPDIRQLYLGIISQNSNPFEWVIGGYEYHTNLIGNSPLLTEFNDIEKMMLLDTISYLPDDILVKVDRASMGVSLEGRVPFLDHRIIEFAWTLPMDYKLHDGQTKWLLRQLLYKFIPKELIERPKMGFGVPIGDWLRGPLRAWAETLLSENRLKQEGYFHPGVIRAKWTEHLSGKRNWQSQLWTVLMFQAWLENEAS
jgi:asparagine synthase (glutamine-hydrolysing)